MTKLPYLLLIVASAALASPTPLVMPPEGWTPDPEQSSSLAQKTTRASLFGVPPTASAAQVYMAPQPGAALFVTRTSLELADVGLAGRAAVDAFAGGARRAELLGAKSEVLESTAADADASKQHTATLTWRDGAQQLTTATRLVLAANAAGVVAVTGECVWTDAAAALAPACKQALATLDTGIPVADRVAIVLAAPTAPAGSAAPAPVPDVPTTPTRTTIPARIDDSGKVHLSPMAIAQTQRDSDRRPVYVGFGIIVLAAVFWWNRRQRERFDRSDAVERGDPAPAAPEADDDADDLHAAAASAPAEAPKDEA